jgi:hypothetical protein
MRDGLVHFLKSLALGTALSWSVILLLFAVSYLFQSSYLFLLLLWLTAAILLWGIVQGWLFDIIDHLVDWLEERQYERRSRA